MYIYYTYTYIYVIYVALSKISNSISISVVSFFSYITRIMCSYKFAFILRGTFNPRRRRRSSNASRKTEEGTNEDDINNCSICQYEIIELDVIQLQPCNHNFHKDCINNMRVYNPMVGPITKQVQFIQLSTDL